MVAPIAVQLGIQLRIVDSILLCSARPSSFFLLLLLLRH